LKKNFLFVLPEKDENFVKSSRNIPRAKTILVNYINLADLLKFKNIIFVKDATKKMEEIFLKTY
jgi:large subunit ribosomal protein L4